MSDNSLKATKRLMGALLRMPPKPHSEMKLGKSTEWPDKSPVAKRPTNDGLFTQVLTGGR
jgi:hypothetical protein